MNLSYKTNKYSSFVKNPGIYWRVCPDKRCFIKNNRYEKACFYGCFSCWYGMYL